MIATHPSAAGSDYHPIRCAVQLIVAALLLSLAFGELAPATIHAAEMPHLFRIGTGGPSGVYYPIGKSIARALTDRNDDIDQAAVARSGIPGYIGVAQNSAGSVENVRAVVSGEIEAGLVQADIAAQAFQAEPPFIGSAVAGSIRAVASLYPEKLQIVTRRDADIRSIGDFRGKRISIDEIGSGTMAVMQRVLAAYGLTEADFSAVYLKPAFTEDKIISGDLDGFVMMAGTPMDAVIRLGRIGLRFVPVDPAIAASIHAKVPYLVPGIIPQGVYPDTPETPTLQVHALLVVDAALDEDLVYRFTAVLWSPQSRDILDGGHHQGRNITLQTALAGVSIPLHPGAQRFYREHGILP